MVDAVNVLNGNTFVLSDGVGDVTLDPALMHGFFADDTRFLSTWRLLVDGHEPQPVTVAQDEHFSAQFFLMPAAPDVYRPGDLSIVRRRAVDDVWVEEIRLMSHSSEPRTVELSIEAAADFADLFEVKDRAVEQRDVRTTFDERGIVLAYRNGGFVRETRIACSRAGAVTDAGFAIRADVDARSEWAVRFIVSPHSEQRGRSSWPRWSGGSFDVTAGRLRAELREWMTAAPRLRSDSRGLELAYERSLEDLAALRFRPDVRRREQVTAAGLPWFMALFGRDSLIASYQSLPFVPELARRTLGFLAEYQGTEIDDVRDEEPGKILHELRYGELTATGRLPYSPYYGTIDATPLFLVVLDEHRLWTGDDSLARKLEPAARAAIGWMTEHADLDGDGFVEYQRRNERTGLVNQCWKDSWDSMRFRDGSTAEPPLAPCEAQGYVYDAKLRAARLSEEVWGDQPLAVSLREQAAELRARFNDAFWVEDRAGYALALDREKRQVDSMTSNIGHLLWSGIADPERAPLVAGHLTAPHLFTGFGVRTMSTLDAGFNPIGYHVGTVWPHDTSIAAAGLARYGFHDAAATLAGGLIGAAHAFGGRLPEAFAGYASDLTRLPVEYPTSAAPQAWAAGALLLLLRAMLGLDPLQPGRAVLPEAIGEVVISGLHVRGAVREIRVVEDSPA